VAGPWLCTLASPYGLALPGYYRSVLGNSSLAHAVSEWGPSTLRGQPVFFVVLFVASWLAARRPESLTPFARLALAATGVLGLLAVRNMVWFALVAAAVLPAALDAIWQPSRGERRPGLNGALAVVGLATFGALAAAAFAHGRDWFEYRYPRAAAAAVAAAARAEPGARIFADDRYADWLLFREPQLAGRVAYDVRFELLTDRQLSEIVAFNAERGLDWQRAADGYGLLVLDSARDKGAVALFKREPGTTVLYRDRNVVVLRVPRAP
jgi:hypothetical protein